MIYTLSCRITLEPLEPFTFVTDVEIDSSSKNLTDTAVVRFPRALKLRESNLRDILKKGQTAKIELGYDGQLSTEFEGYISRVKPGVPFEIHLEDEMWKLKQKRFSCSHASVTLSGLVSQMLEGTGYAHKIMGDMQLGKLRVDGATAARVFDELGQKYGVAVFFRGKTLYAGLRHLGSFEYGRTQPYVLGLEVNAKNSSLEYLEAGDRKIKAKAVSVLPDNHKVEAEAGDPDGELRTLHFYGIRDKSELKKRADSEVGRLKVAGYKGALWTFGKFGIRHGDRVTVTDNEYPEREGTYRTDAVRTTFGHGGYHKEITLGERIGL